MGSSPTGGSSFFLSVLLCLVCLFDLACFFLSSFSSLIYVISGAHEPPKAARSFQLRIIAQNGINDMGIDCPETSRNKRWHGAARAVQSECRIFLHPESSALTCSPASVPLRSCADRIRSDVEGKDRSAVLQRKTRYARRASTQQQLLLISIFILAQSVGISFACLSHC